MQDDVIDLVMDETPEDLDNTHESLIIQGSIDAIDGNESYAVKYLAGAMCGADMLPISAIHGNESVWSTVKSGFSKSITYIKNFFKGIWDFFFGKSADEKDTAENAEVEKEKSELAKLPAGSELSESANTAIMSAAGKGDDLVSRLIAKLDIAGEHAHLLGEDKALKEKLDAALVKLGELYKKGVTAAKKQGKGLSEAAAKKAALWSIYFKEFRGVMTSQVKAIASKTLSEIERLESKVKSAGESASAEIKEKLASLKEVIKSYTAIQQMKASFRSFVTGIIAKLKPSFFSKKGA